MFSSFQILQNLRNIEQKLIIGIIQLIIYNILINNDFILVLLRTFLFFLQNLIFFKLEKTERNNFFELKSENKNFYQIQKLIHEKIQCGVLVITNEDKNLKVQFANKILLQQFQIDSDDKILEKLKEIQIKKEGEKGSFYEKISVYLSKQGCYIQENHIFQLKQNLQYKNILKNSLNIIENSINNACLIQKTQRKLEKNSQSDFSYDFFKEDINEKSFDFKLNYSFWEEKPCLVILISDSMQKIINKKIQEIEKYKEQLLYMISHISKTPLNSIINMSEVLLYQFTKEELEEKRQDFVQNLHIIKNNGLILLYSIYNITDLSQNIDVNVEKFDFKSIIGGILDIYLYQIGEKSLQVKQKYEIIEIQNDKKRLMQVLFEIVGNAIKYTQKGRIQIQTKNENEHLFWIKISDTGQGISQNIQNKMFNFLKKNHSNQEHQIDQFSHKSFAGLGLEFTRKIAGILGPFDKVFINSGVNKGASFKFLIYKNYQNREMVNIKNLKRKIMQDLNERNEEILTPDYVQINKRNKQLFTCQNIGYLQKKQRFLRFSQDLKVEKYQIDQKSKFKKSNEVHKVKDSFIMEKINENQINSLEKIKFLKEDDLNSVKFPYQNLTKENDLKKIENKDLTFKKIKTKHYFNQQSLKKTTFLKQQSDMDNIYNQLNQIFQQPSYILATDDTPFNLFVLEKSLEKCKNIIFHKANSGKQCIEQALLLKLKHQKDYMLYFMDIQMPDMDGYQSFKQLQVLMDSQQIKQAPVFALTAFSEEKQKCLQSGMQGFIEKPYLLKDLVEILYNYFVINIIYNQQNTKN
ncbi:hypothetical protein IMG5_150210 [Ichthyophthirius multifiliis]|uniref:Histidine kinase n=1 Tax=Ichthyophthirius multifiliis TaxID=5932 RepID=G0QYJ6_ICHMU|nr:hypothetical protein IMG5_150210 [Ichthyophthirius multifiliis]EGR29703.1 hypothetical protein IMG5_150210 [Ichthyophthirius multifiliis]|eukprot:XP_004030939.1 hypothetical protein IMG5_150210 [Ichthyophthirius multifiliis]